MKNVVIWACILAIIGYIILNYQETQYHYYEGVNLRMESTHRAIMAGSSPEDIEFLKRGGFEVIGGKGTVIEYAKLVKKATPNINDDEIEAFTIFLPFSNIESGTSKSFNPASGALVYYIGNKNRFPCYGYPTNGKIIVSHKGAVELTASISFVVDLLTVDGSSCKTVEFNKDVKFKRASVGETWGSGS